MRTFFEMNHAQVALLQFGEVSRDRSKRGGAPLGKTEASVPFELIEADEHEAHVIFAVGIDTPKGVKHVPCSRLSLILAVDRFTNFILAWHIVVRRQIASEDFLECMDQAINGQCLSEELNGILQAKLGYDANGSEIGPDGLQLGFDSILIDNALAHLSDAVCTKLRQVAGAAVSFGAIRRPQRRALVEHVFSWLGREVFHRSLSTTGNTPVDTRRYHPEAQAVRCKVTLSELIQETGKAVRRWNSKRTEANYGSSPEEQMLEYYQNVDGALAPVLPPRQLSLPPLRAAICHPTVRGSQARGRPPYVSYETVEYSSKELALRWSLIGNSITIYADPYDISSIRAYTDNGIEIGQLVPLSSRWRFPHSLQMRSLLKLQIKYCHDQPVRDPVKKQLEDLEQEALAANVKRPKTTKAATTLAEEARKGYVADPLAVRGRGSEQVSTKQLARRVRKRRDIDFSLVGRS